MPTTDMWVGAPTATTMRVRGKVAGTSPTLEVFDSPSLSGSPVIAPIPATPNARGIASWDVAGLAPGHRYWCAVRTSGALDTSVVGRFRTARTVVGQPESYGFATWTCAGLEPRFPGAQPYVSNHPVLDVITDEVDPDFLVIGGDLHYLDNTAPSVEPYHGAYDAVLHKTSTARMSRHLRQMPTVYQLDDHDAGGGNDSDGTDAAMPYAVEAYQQRVPHFPLPTTSALYHAFQRGRVLHIVSDVRSARSPNLDPDGPGKTMLGAAQLAWMETLLSTSDAEFLVWHMPSQWMGVSQDSWAQFTHERGLLVDMLAAPGGDASRNWLPRMIQTSGDVHALAIDDGTGNRWGGFPVLVAASLDSRSGGAQDGIYRLGGRYLPSSPGRARYGVVSIDDDGDKITCTLDGYVRRWRRFRHSFTVHTGASITPATGTAEVTAVATVDWGQGPETVEPVRWSVEREIPTSLPDQVRRVAGVSAASAKLALPARVEAAMGSWSPWRRNNLRSTLRPVTIDAVIDGERHPQFVGESTDAGTGARDVELNMSALDAARLLNTPLPVPLPAYVAEMGAPKPSASLLWVMEHVLHAYGMSPLPRFAGPEVAGAASLAGSLMPNIGSIRREDQHGFEGEQAVFEDVPDLPFPATANANTWIYPDNTWEGWTAFTIGAVYGVPTAPSDNPLVRLQLAFKNASNVLTVFYIRFYAGPDRCRIHFEHAGGANSGFLDGGEMIDFGPTWYRFRRSGNNATLEVIQRGQIVVSATIPVPGLSDPTMGLYDMVVTPLTVPVQGVQFIHGDIPIADLPQWSQDDVYADLDAPLSRIDGVPGLGQTTGLAVLRDIADAEQGGCWISEDGIPTFRNRASFLGLGQDVIPVTSESSIIDLTWQETSDQIRSLVAVDTTRPVATFAVNDPPEIEVFAADQKFRIEARQWLRLEVELNTPVGLLDRYLRRGGSAGSRFTAYFSHLGNGSPATAFIASYRVRSARLVSSTRARIDLYNPHSRPIWLVDNNGDPNLRLCAHMTIGTTDVVAVTRDTGVPDAGELRMPANPWRQHIVDAEQLAVYIAAEVAQPRPFIEGVRVVPHPRIRLGTVIDLIDPDVTGISVRALVRKTVVAGEPGRLTQTLEVQPLPIALAAVDERWTGQTLGDFDTHWSGRNLGDSDADPLED